MMGSEIAAGMMTKMEIVRAMGMGMGMVMRMGMVMGTGMMMGMGDMAINITGSFVWRP